MEDHTEDPDHAEPAHAEPAPLPPAPEPAQAPAPALAVPAKSSVDWSKYAECYAMENVKANHEAGVYERTAASLEIDIAALPLAES